MTFRSTTALAATAVSATALTAVALLAAPATARAETALPFGVPTVKGLGITGQVEDMVLADGRVWISTGNEVDVFSTAGTKLATITGLLGADGLLASADGTKVYVGVSQDARIITLDAGSMTPSASWPASACPTHLALAAGRLFYSHGCGNLAGGIGSLSLADGSAGPVVADALDSAPQLHGGGDILIAADQSGAPTAMDSYQVAADGTATKLASTRTGEDYDYAVSPDGAQLIVTGYDSGYTIERYNTADLSVAGNFAMGPYPTAVAYSPDGAVLAGALQSSSTDLIRVFNATSGQLISHGFPTGPAYQAPVVLPGTLRFSADGTLLYGIAEVNQVAQLVTASAQPVKTASLTATVTNPTGYGRAGTVRVSAPGRPHARVLVAVPSTGGTKTYTGTTDAGGTAVVHPVSPYSGVVTVTLPGDLRHAGRTIARSITVPAKLTLTPTGYSSSAGGIKHYRSIGAVHIDTAALPRRQLKLHVLLQARVGGGWKTVSTGTYLSGYDGSSYIYLKSANKHLRYRVVLSFAGDQTNSKAPTVVSPTFIID